MSVESVLHPSCSFIDENHTHNKVFPVVKLTCSLFCFSDVDIKMMIVDTQWNRTILRVKLHHVELKAGQLLPFPISPVQSPINEVLVSIPVKEEDLLTAK